MTSSATSSRVQIEFKVGCTEIVIAPELISGMLSALKSSFIRHLHPKSDMTLKMAAKCAYAYYEMSGFQV